MIFLTQGLHNMGTSIQLATFFIVIFSIIIVGLTLLALNNLFNLGWEHVFEHPINRHCRAILDATQREVDRTNETLKKSIANQNPYAVDEEQCVKGLLNAHSAFMKLESTHQTKAEWVTSFHHLQDILNHRVLHRHYPDYFTKP